VQADHWATREQPPHGIFNAYYFPRAAMKPVPTITPVNGFRLMFNRYRGTYPLLPDQSYFSIYDNPAISIHPQ
jgi:hypothetical protein